jgi:hypothetical protein
VENIEEYVAREGAAESAADTAAPRAAGG